MTPFKAMFGVNAFDTWGELDLNLGRNKEEPGILADSLALLHCNLVGN